VAGGLLQDRARAERAKVCVNWLAATPAVKWRFYVSADISGSVFATSGDG
jgi:hypothetical protein